MKLWMLEKPQAYTTAMSQWFKTEGLPAYCNLFSSQGQRSAGVSQEHITLDDGSARNRDRGAATEENV